MKSKLLKTKFVISLILLVVSTLSFAQQGINYQGVARDSEGEVIVDTEITLELNINQATADGTTVYNESHTVFTDANGVFSIVIGDGVSLGTDSFEDVNWAEDKHFLNVWLNGEEIGTTELLAVPYTHAIGKWQAHGNGVTPKSTGGSVFIGESSGASDDLDDNNNIGIGNLTLFSNTTGVRNTALGEEALYSNETGTNNFAVGYKALYENTTGLGNIGLGLFALHHNRDGFANVALGGYALRNNTLGRVNIAIGSRSMYHNTLGDNNVAIGEEALFWNDNGNYNIALGFQGLKQNISGANNIAAGYNSLLNNTSGSYNIAIGNEALESTTFISDLIAIGNEALKDNINGDFGIAIGKEALTSNTDGNGNVAMGYESLFKNTTGNFNTAIGYRTLAEGVDSQWNTAIGGSALNDHVSGGFNIAVGVNALTSHVDGMRNIGIGTAALILSETGSENIGIGSNSGRNNISGNQNSFIGIRSGYNNEGSGNVFLGYYSGYNETSSNKLYIENSDSSTPLIYGEFDNEILGFDAKVGIGTQSPAVPLHIRGGSDVTIGLGTGQLVLGDELGTNMALDNNEIQARNAGVVSDLYLQNEGGDVRIGGAIVQVSDRRLKRDIENISYGLEEIMQLRPTEYFWVGKEQEYKSLGLIAQEVNAVINNVVSYSEDQDKYGVSYTELIPVLIKAIQEQNHIIKAQQKRNNRQSRELAELTERIKAIETLLSEANGIEGY
ncbi:tail fiber domain-containing protein [Winogradskyella sp. 3972H.M.0a.05]|uniref:tail fiber domain-containing protein n=1 Tax=Winogradskyella sp. 3972H.M.0a.05 TaxID=2950277 RepID=UPI0033977546